jgi:hypothetical protein
MEINFKIILLAAIVPLLIGFVWYNPKVLGNAWMSASGMTEDKMKGSNMGLIFGLTFLCSFFIAFTLQFIVIHQYGALALLSTHPGFENPDSEAAQLLKNFMTLAGNDYRTFKHGAFHGTLTGLFFATPIITIVSLFERRSFKYIALHAGYWIISVALMGGILCAWC